MNALASQWADCLLRSSIEGAILISIAFLLSYPLRGYTSSMLVWLWRLICLKLILSLFGFGIPLLPGIDATVETGSMTEAQTNLIPMLICASSIVGFITALARLQSDYRQIQAIKQTCTPLDSATARSQISVLCCQLGIRRAPQLLLSKQLKRPILIGSFSPAIILPSSLIDTLEPAQLEMVLAHELTHIKRRDLLWSWLPALVQFIFFYHPLCWLALRELHLLQEVACDQQAIRTARKPRGEYAHLLLKISHSPLESIHSPALALGASASFHLLKRRLEAIEMERPSTFKGLLTSCLLIAVIPILFMTTTQPSNSAQRMPSLRQDLQTPYTGVQVQPKIAAPVGGAFSPSEIKPVVPFRP